MTSLEQFQTTLDTINELLAPATAFDSSSKAEQVADDLLVIQTLALDLAIAGFKVSIHVHDSEWRISIEQRIGDIQFQAMARGGSYVEAFAGLHKSARKRIAKLTANLLEAEELDVAA